MTVNDRFESTWDKIVAHFNIWKPEKAFKYYSEILLLE
jgi:hypothetical protein